MTRSIERELGIEASVCEEFHNWFVYSPDEHDYHELFDVV